MKVSELQGAELNYWVAKAEGYEAKLSKTHPTDGYPLYEDSVSCWVYKKIDDEDDEYHWSIYEPSWMWHDGGPIIEREKIEVNPFAMPVMGNAWTAIVCELKGLGARSKHYNGPTPLIAAMRARVASKYGEEVDENQP